MLCWLSHFYLYYSKNHSILGIGWCFFHNRSDIGYWWRKIHDVSTLKDNLQKITCYYLSKSGFWKDLYMYKIILALCLSDLMHLYKYKISSLDLKYISIYFITCVLEQIIQWIMCIHTSKSHTGRGKNYEVKWEL